MALLQTETVYHCLESSTVLLCNLIVIIIQNGLENDAISISLCVYTNTGRRDMDT